VSPEEINNTGEMVKATGEVAKAVGEKLIDRIADAAGVIYEPHRIVRKAQAEAKAKMIEASAHIEITEMQRKAATRWIQEETRNQINMESIIGKALPYVSEDAKPENISDDWIANFFSKSRLFSDEELQNLWSKILAGEANNPGKFSRRTVNVLADFDQKIALDFSNLCRFIRKSANQLN
jgi:hypothetical protein